MNTKLAIITDIFPCDAYYGVKEEWIGRVVRVDMDRKMTEHAEYRGLIRAGFYFMEIEWAFYFHDVEIKFLQ